MLKRKTLGDAVFDILNYTILSILAIICIYPFAYIIFASFSLPDRLMAHTGLLLKPLGFTLKGYDFVFRDPGIITGYLNTIFYVVAGTSFSLFCTSIAAYVLSRKNLKYTKYLMAIIVFTMYFGGGLIPYYLVIKQLGLINNRLVMILPGAISTWNMIIMRTSFREIPDSIEESAKIDGASDFTILFKIILPLSKALLATMVLFYGVAIWNDWFTSLIFMKDSTKYPLQLVLRKILIVNDTSASTNAGRLGLLEQNEYKRLIKYCAIVVSVVPVILAYPFLQKYFVKGVMVGSIKG